MSQQETWNGSFEAAPNLDTRGFLLSQAVTSTRYNTRRIAEKEHQFDISGTSFEELQGIHKKGSAMAYVGETDPTTRPDGTALDPTEDEGRLFVDTTDSLFTPKVYSGGAWEELNLGLTGMIANFPRTTTPNAGWILCNGAQISAVGHPERAALIAYLNAGSGENTAYLPRMTDGTAGRYVKNVASGGEEAYNGQQSPKLLAETIGVHSHTTSIPGAGTGSAVAGKWTHATRDYTTLDSSTDGIEDLFDGKHKHWYNKWGTGSGTSAQFSTESFETELGGAHQHKITVTTLDLEHSHNVSTNGWAAGATSPDSVNRPASICLYPFIHI